MTENRTIFDHKDEDQDRLQVNAWATRLGFIETGPNLIFKGERGDDLELVSVRLYPDQVRALVVSLTVWLASVDGSETVRGLEPEPEPRTVSPAPESRRRAALELAVAFGQYASENQHVNVLEVAEEFENYLRFGRQVEPEFEPEPQITGVCPRCEHPLSRHGAGGCRVGHPETSTGWRNDNACGCTGPGVKTDCDGSECTGCGDEQCRALLADGGNA